MEEERGYQSEKPEKIKDTERTPAGPSVSTDPKGIYDAREISPGENKILDHAKEQDRDIEKNEEKFRERKEKKLEVEGKLRVAAGEREKERKRNALEKDRINKIKRQGQENQKNRKAIGDARVSTRKLQADAKLKMLDSGQGLQNINQKPQAQNDLAKLRESRNGGPISNRRTSNNRDPER